MIKRNITIISLIFFLSSCWFTPIYLKNDNFNFSIEEINFTGDRELNNFLRINLNKHKNKKINNKVFIDAESN